MQIQDHVPLAPLHTFSIQNTARRVIHVESEQDLHELYQKGIFKEPFLILGEGSNTIFLTPVEQTIIRIGLPGIHSATAPPVTKKDQASKKDADSEKSPVWVTAGAGVHWDELVKWTVDQELGGIENLSLIPGTCGAAPVQNIGAYGVDLSDVFYSTSFFDTRTGEIKTLFKEQCEFQYRDSVFKRSPDEGGLRGIAIILSITLKLSKYRHYQPVLTYQGVADRLLQDGVDTRRKPELHEIREAVCAIRRSKLPDPDVVPNSGSFFKNPIITSSEAAQLKQLFPDLPCYHLENEQVKIPAGWLIEQTGWKGIMRDSIGTWPKQALVIIQNGQASGRELVHFIDQMMTSVREKFGIELEPEVQLIGTETLITHGR